MIFHEWNWMINPRADGTEFNPYQTVLWEALRREYPAKIDPMALKGPNIIHQPQNENLETRD